MHAMFVGNYFNLFEKLFMPYARMLVEVRKRGNEPHGCKEEEENSSRPLTHPLMENIHPDFSHASIIIEVGKKKQMGILWKKNGRLLWSINV